MCAKCANLIADNAEEAVLFTALMALSLPRIRYALGVHLDGQNIGRREIGIRRFAKYLKPASRKRLAVSQPPIDGRNVH